MLGANLQRDLYPIVDERFLSAAEVEIGSTIYARQCRMHTYPTSPLEADLRENFWRRGGGGGKHTPPTSPLEADLRENFWRKGGGEERTPLLPHL